ncbi:MAG: hypothetical protein GF375_07235, partial [Candidatus Omnitrophica bacterium]|nr:hypothetical protein [Candidatus Omnitrophota bacterium]MBD3269769.1 hypothetical protein [Candidatus Omnitrophota bacterium]
IKKVIFRPSDLMWDSDINPEGLSIQLDKDFGGGFSGFFNTGVWMLDEDSSDTSDRFMTVVQPGFQYKWGRAKLGVAVASYFIDNIEDTILNNGGDSSGSYNTIEGSGLKYKYNVISPGVKLEVKEPFGDPVIQKIKLFGDFVHNPDPSDEENGWLGGVEFKIGGPLKIFDKEWKLAYLHRRLEKDAWLDIFPDSDAYSGHTDVKGHEIKIGYPLGKNTSLGFDYYLMERIQGQGRRHVFQADWMMEF